MASDIEAANALKLKGNKAFAEHEWPTAVDFYTKAIEKYDKEPSFFSNRAQVCNSEFGRVVAEVKLTGIGAYQTRGAWVCDCGCYEGVRA